MLQDRKDDPNRGLNEKLAHYTNAVIALDQIHWEKQKSSPEQATVNELANDPEIKKIIRLYEAIKKGELKTVEACLKDDSIRAIINEPIKLELGFRGRTTFLMVSIGADYNANKQAIVTALVKAGADVNQAKEGAAPPLHWATSSKDWEVSRILVENKADINAKNEYGKPALDYLFCWGYKEYWEFAKKYLLKPGANLSFIDGSILLRSLSRLQPVDMLAFIYYMWPESITMVHMVDMNVNDTKGNNVALQHAIEWGETERAALALHSLSTVDKEEFQNQCSRALHTALRLNGEVTKQHSSYDGKTCLGIISMAALLGARIDENYKEERRRKEEYYHQMDELYVDQTLRGRDIAIMRKEDLAYAIGARAAEIVQEQEFKLARKDPVLFKDTILGINVLADIVQQYLVPKSRVPLPAGISQKQLDTAAKKYLIVYIRMINGLDKLIAETREKYAFLKSSQQQEQRNKGFRPGD